MITVEEMQSLFRELLYLIYNVCRDEVWVLEQLQQILKSLELYSQAQLQRELQNRE